MASSNSNVVTVVGVIAIAVIVGIAAYFVMRETGDEPAAEFRLEIEDTSALVVPAHVA